MDYSKTKNSHKKVFNKYRRQWLLIFSHNFHLNGELCPLLKIMLRIPLEYQLWRTKYSLTSQHISKYILVSLGLVSQYTDMFYLSYILRIDNLYTGIAFHDCKMLRPWVWQITIATFILQTICVTQLCDVLSLHGETGP